MNTTLSALLLAYAVAVESRAPEADVLKVRAAVNHAAWAGHASAMHTQGSGYRARYLRTLACWFAATAILEPTADDARRWAAEEQEREAEALAVATVRASSLEMREGADGSIGFYRREPDA